VLERFQGIAAAGKNVISTDVPASQLATFLDLAMKAKSQKVHSVQFVPPLITPAYPDFALIRRSVTAAVLASASGQEPAATPTTSPVPGAGEPTHRAATTSTAGSRATGTSTRAAAAPSAAQAQAGVDVGSICRPAG
jgi:hypothetical protein